MAFPHDGNKFDKGESGNPNGRPRKMVTLLKGLGYSRSDVVTTIENMMGMTLEELAAIYKNDDATILERTIAHAMKKSLDKGSLYSVETLISRAHGMPKQETDNTNKNIEQPFFNDVPKNDSDKQNTSS